MTNLERFKDNLKMERLSIHTINNYVSDIKSMLDYINKNDEDIKYQDLIDWQSSMAEYKPATINRKLMAVRKYFNLLESLEIIIANPAIKIKMVKLAELNNDEGYIPMEEAKKLIPYAKSYRDKAILSVFLTTGIRFSEMASLTLSDYNKDSVKIKTKGSKYREIIFTESCRCYVDKYLEVRGEADIDNLFISTQGTVIKNNSFNSTLKNIGKRAGIETNIHAHSLRHTVVSDVCDKYDISMASRFIGHSSVKITERYVHKTREEIINVYNSLSL